MKSGPPTAGDRICIPKKVDAQELRILSRRNNSSFPTGSRSPREWDTPLVHKPGKLKIVQLFLGQKSVTVSHRGRQQFTRGSRTVPNRESIAREKARSGKRLQTEMGELKAKNVKWVVVNLEGQKRQENGEVINSCYLELTFRTS